jgi:23S rRNA (adenine-N6)-dimethyltransferase
LSRYISRSIVPPVSVSQNFLTSSKTIRRLVGLTDLCRDDHVIEIDPGKGHITEVLAMTCGRVTAVEIDPAMCQKTAQRTAVFGNVNLVHQDFLTYRLPGQDAYKVFSNIPFCITTPIIRKLSESSNPPTQAWLVMERAAARRFAGIPRESIQSLLLKPNFDVEIVCQIRRDDFHPRPSVDVVLFHMHKKAQPDILPGHRRSYERFVTDGKTDAAGLLRRVFTKKQLSMALKRADLECIPPSGEMRYVQWLCLFRSYLATR